MADSIDWNAQESLLIRSSTSDDVKWAFDTWCFPTDAYPYQGLLDLHCDQDWSYLDLMSPCWIYTVIKTWHPPIQVLLLRQAFATKGPGMRHSYFCFWQNPRYPLGEVADATFHGGRNVHHQGHNHAKAKATAMPCMHMHTYVVSIAMCQ